MSDGVAHSYEGVAEWLELSEALLRGLVHALNNRITALSAYSQLAAMGDEEFAPARILPGELLRLQQVNALIGLLIGDNATAGAVELGAVLEDARSLHAHHPQSCIVHCELLPSDPQMLVRAPRWALVRLVLAMMQRATHLVGDSRPECAVLQIRVLEQSITLRAVGSTLSPYTIMMASLCGAAVEDDGGTAMVRLPTLLEVRRREQEARDACEREAGDSTSAAP